MSEETGPFGYKILSQEDIDKLDNSLVGADVQRLSSSPETVAVAALSRTGTTKIGEFDPFDYDTKVRYWNYYEYEFYTHYRKLWKQNSWAYMVAEYLLTEIFGDDFHFEGEGATEVRDFFDKDKTKEKLMLATRQSIIIGNGFLDLRVKNRGKTLVETRVIDGESMRMEFKNGKIIYWQEPTFLYDVTTGVAKKGLINPDRLLHFYFKRYADSPYGMSLYRANLHFLSALQDTGGDIAAALKRTAYAPLVASLNLDNYASEAEKKAVADEFAKKLHKVISATTNYAIDSRHSLEVVGGKGAASLLPVMDLITPLIAVVLINFGMPLGYFLQTGANKAILREQKIGVRKFVKPFIRDALAWNIEHKIIPKITDKKCKVVFNSDIDENVRLRKIMLMEYQVGLISKDYYTDMANIEDKGTNFIPVPMSVKPKDETNEPETEDDTVED